MKGVASAGRLSFHRCVREEGTVHRYMTDGRPTNTQVRFGRVINASGLNFHISPRLSTLLRV